jgi:hypothetical protein
VVFYTALPQHIPPEIQTPVVRVVKKTEGLDKLLEVAQLIFATKLPVVNRALVAHVRDVQRDYMWDFVAKHWDQFGLGAERTDLAYFLARRLAFSLSGAAVDRFVADLPGEQGQAAIREGMVHPMRMYLIPPIQGSPPQAGDLFTGTVHGKDGYWLLLTPSCDVAQNKADWVLLAKCNLLEDTAVYKANHEKASKATQRALLDLLRNNRGERYYYLPAAFTIPHLIVDLQQLEGPLCSELDKLSPAATLDSPYAEALASRFSRYFARLGTPDLDLEVILGNLHIDPK